MDNARTPAPAELTLDEKTATRWFWYFTLGHVLVWTLTHWWFLPNVTLDDAEMIYWGREWQWGYYKHPPLAAWLTEIFFQLCGNSLFGVYLGARICTAICFWAVWRLAKRMVSPGTALIAVAALEACYFLTVEANDLNNNIAPRPFWALAVLALFIAVFEQRLFAWIAAGACLGLAMLGKYDAVVLAGAMLAYSVCDSRGRQAWKTPGPYALLVTALLVFSPHLLWLVEHDFPTLQYFRERCVFENQERAVVSGGYLNHIFYPLQFLAAHAGLLIPVLGICAVATHNSAQARTLSPDERAQHRFLLAMCAGPVIGFVLISAVAGANLSMSWGHMLWLWLPLTIFALRQIEIPRSKVRPLLGLCAIAGAVLVTICVVRTVAYPHYMHSGLRRHFPGSEIAREVERRWQATTDLPLQIVGGDDWIAGNVSLYSPQRPSVYCELSPRCSPWLNDELLEKRGGVVVWQEGQPDAVIRAHLERFPNAREVAPIVAHWQTTAEVKPVTIHVAIVPPATSLR